MQTWKKSLVAGALLMAAVGTAAWASDGAGGGKMRHRRFMNHFIQARVETALDEIDATPDQRKTILAVKDEILAKLQAHHEKHPNPHHAMIEAILADHLDTNALTAEVDRRADEMRAMGRELIPEIQKIHDTLTPAQRQTLAAKWQAREHHHDEHDGQ